MEWRGGHEERERENWGEREFREVELGDRRLEQRLKRLAEDLAARPQAPINQASADWAATKAAYGFFENAKVSAEKIFQAHRTNTVQRMSQHEVVLAIQDTTSLNYSPHPQTTGLGPIGDSRSAAHGLMMHSTLVVTAAGLPLGLLTHALWVRDGYKEQSSRARKNTAIEEKESYRWITALQQTAERAPRTTTVVTLCDREADIYEFLAEAHRLETQFVVRAAWDRHVKHSASPRLWPLVEAQAIAGSVTLDLPPRKTRPARTARLAVRFTLVPLAPPQRPRTAGRLPLPLLSVYAVHVKELAPPPDEPAVEWMLLTNVPIHSFADACERVAWYRNRWQIEEFHKILKSGCQVETCRLQTAQRLIRYVTLTSVIAWRLYWFTHLNRTAPTDKATTILTAEELAALQTLGSKRESSAVPPLTIREAVRRIAQLGGFLGRRQDGEPGITAIWRGWQRLSDFALMWSLVTERTLMGNS